MRAAVLATIVLTGCATYSAAGPVDINAPAEDAAWADAVRAHTRADKSWDFPVMTSDLRATLVTPRLRAIYAAHRGEFHGKQADEFQELLLLAEPPKGARKNDLEKASAPEAQVIVFASFYVKDLVHRDIAAGYTEWDTNLRRGEAKVGPVKIEKLRYTPGLKALLPHADRFDETWVLRFPATDPDSGASLLAPGGDPLELSIVSASAAVSVTWSLEGTE